MKTIAGPLLAALMLPGLCLAEEVPLSIDITLAARQDYADAIALIRRAGADITSLSLFWDDLEKVSGQYAPEFDWPAIANVYYPAEGIALTLTFSVIDTVTDRRPADLRGQAWDDPATLQAFAEHLGRVLPTLDRVDILTVSIGNEVDAYLSSPSDIAAYARFLGHARETVQRLRPDLPVGTKLTFGGLTADPARWQPLLAESTAMMVTYYPLDAGFAVRPVSDVEGDLDRIIAQRSGLPVYLLETGYPSDGCGASEAAQQDFVKTLLDAAGKRSDVIKLVSLTFLSDLPKAEVASYLDYYGIPTDCFRRYLSSLGLRRDARHDKPAFRWLVERQ